MLTYLNESHLAGMIASVAVERGDDPSVGFGVAYRVEKMANNSMALEPGKRTAKELYEQTKDKLQKVNDLSIDSPVRVEVHSPELYSSEDDVYTVKVLIAPPAKQ